MLSNLSSQSSNVVSFEKSASTAPAFVPVAINGCVGPGDHAKVAVLGISRRRTMAAVAVARSCQARQAGLRCVKMENPKERDL